uniref:Transcription factor CBF/NF-Y/archaeal histone domain-containing protein n=1 Tax=Otus sunia TaxID=257818 RepID=A0A8C8B6M8_9STRI
AEGAVGRWNGLPRAGGESPSLEGLKSRVHPALRDLGELGTVRVRFMVGLEELQGPFQPRWFCARPSSSLFVETIAKDAYVYAQQGKRKTLQRKDLDNAIEAIDEFAFLEGEFLLGFTWFQCFV